MVIVWNNQPATAESSARLADSVHGGETLFGCWHLGDHFEPVQERACLNANAITALGQDLCC
jgi:hypothetical protein